MIREQLKTHARRLRADLARQGTFISNSAALDLTARMHGFDSWNATPDQDANVHTLFAWLSDLGGPSFISHHPDERSAHEAAQRYANTHRADHGREYPDDALTGPYAPGAPLTWYEPAVKDLHATQMAAQLNEDGGGPQLILIHAPLTP